MRTSAAPALLLAALLAGCSSPPGPDPAGDAAPAPVFSLATAVADPCPALREVECFEASVAADPQGRLFVANTSCLAIAASVDGGATFHEVAVPPPVAGMRPGASLGDCTLQADPEGRLWFSALVHEASFGLAAAGLYGGFTGVQVARSDDGGASWPVDHLFAAPLRPADDDSAYPVSAPPFVRQRLVGLDADRQWLAFGPDAVWFAQWDWRMGQTFVARSLDGGASWTDQEAIPGYLAGPPVIDAQGAFHQPSQDFGDPYTVFDTIVEASAGEGLVARQVAAHTASEGGLWCAYPALAAAPDGTLFLAWQEAAQRVLVASSADRGATWSAPAPWSRPDTQLTRGQRFDGDGPCPAVRAVGGDLVVMWYEQDRQDNRTQSAVLARAPLSAVAGGPVSWTAAASYPAESQTTDFASFAALPDGRLAVAFTDPAVGMRVAVEQPAG